MLLHLTEWAASWRFLLQLHCALLKLVRSQQPFSSASLVALEFSKQHSTGTQAMASTRSRKRPAAFQTHDEDLHSWLFAVLQTCCFSTSMKHEDTMCLLARLAASSKQLRAVVSASLDCLGLGPRGWLRQLHVAEDSASSSTSTSTSSSNGCSNTNRSSPCTSDALLGVALQL